MTATVLIGCRDASHETRAVTVQSFSRGEDGKGGRRWVLDSPAKREAYGYATSRPAKPEMAAVLVGDTPVRKGSLEHIAAAGSGAVRRRYTLRCEPCSLNVVIRSEKLYPILDGIADAGESYIELGHLARIIS